ncbi:hypothetical protein [Aliihoeflea sp. PC F10.4]
MKIAVSDFAWCAIAGIAVRCGAAAHQAEGGRDKKRHIAARLECCFACAFWISAHIADQAREVRAKVFSCDFSGNRTSRRKRP